MFCWQYRLNETYLALSSSLPTLALPLDLIYTAMYGVRKTFPAVLLGIWCKGVARERPESLVDTSILRLSLSRIRPYFYKPE